MATTTRKDLPIWARPRPGRLGATQPLTAAQKRKAKARAQAAGRKYPNLVDNIAAARNPAMKKPSPAQLAARKRFAEMARSGAFKKATKRKKNPTEIGMRYQIFKSNGPLDSEYKTLAQMQSALDEIDRKPSGRYYGYDKAFGRTYHSFAHNTPSAVVKNNPMHKYTVLFRGTRNVAGEVTASGPQAAKQKVAEKLELPTLAYLVARKTNPTKKTVSQKISQLVHEGYPQRQAVAVALSEQRAGKVKRNPMGEIQAYAITRNFKVLGIFQTKQDAIKAAQGISDATGKTLAIKPVQVMAGHFNK